MGLYAKRKHVKVISKDPTKQSMKNILKTTHGNNATRNKTNIQIPAGTYLYHMNVVNRLR